MQFVRLGGLSTATVCSTKAIRQTKLYIVRKRKIPSKYMYAYLVFDNSDYWINTIFGYNYTVDKEHNTITIYNHDLHFGQTPKIIAQINCTDIREENYV